jgi:hypothetical protein
LVSKNTLPSILYQAFFTRHSLPGIRVRAVENESGRQGAPQLTQASKSTLSALVAADFEDPAPSDANLDPVALSQIKRIDDRSG